MNLSRFTALGCVWPTPATAIPAPKSKYTLSSRSCTTTPCAVFATSSLLRESDFDMTLLSRLIEARDFGPGGLTLTSGLTYLTNLPMHLLTNESQSIRLKLLRAISIDCNTVKGQSCK